MRSVFCVLTGLLFGIVPALAEVPPSCRGDDPLAALRRDKPEAYAAFEAEMATVPNAEGLLWRIEKDGRPPSHLFGTIHITDERVTALPDAVLKALDGSDIAAFELAAIDNPKDKAKLAARALVRAMNIGGPPALADFSREERARVAAALAVRRLDPAMISSVKPWFLAMSLSYTACEMRRIQAKILTVDERLAQLARGRGLPTLGLEKDLEQLEVMVSLEPWIVEAVLRSASLSEERNEDLVELLVGLYRDRRIGGMMAALRQIAGPEENLGATLAFIKALMGARNGVMRDRSLSMLEEGRAFIAVGALHLPGEDGLVELYRKAGYRLTRLW